MRVNWFFVGSMLVVAAVATPIRSGEEVNEPKTATLPVAEPDDEAAEQVANEILRLRETIGPVWRDETILDSGPSPPVEREVLRTALMAEARANGEDSQPVLPSSSNQRDAMRQAAYQLDVAAHALECQELFEQADEVRGVAGRLRTQAREMRMNVLSRDGKLFVPAGCNSAD
jgi:hypothetical protein